MEKTTSIQSMQLHTDKGHVADDNNIAKNTDVNIYIDVDIDVNINVAH